MKVSIIIPSYNRVNLIGETLDTILAQTYTNWECLVIDDGSNDNSQKLYDIYKVKDNRFLFFKRPKSKPKGANTCRNIGLENTSGDYIVFFDSDDLMTPNHLQVKVDGMLRFNCDYVITRTKFFNADLNYIDSYYRFNDYPITPYNYVKQNINWLTYDICLKQELAKSISFNEKLQSGQEYNYFCKLVFITTNAFFVDEVVSLRRHHDDSIRSKLSSNSALKESYFRVSWYTYVDIKKVADRKSQMVLLRRCINACFEEKSIKWIPKLPFAMAVLKVYRLNSIYILLLLFSLSFFGKGYVFHKRIK